ncbi:YceI family protein [Mucilaginibacter myungsuensis]|uniref:YceI family protein n=1 Tax=Mucilaginibacter myungsuensis TaxID=649104 RepID=A0A929KV31_9SPHI|nr:YceI family protein [Mucilaginibacter myungsuensis]MBE9662126.1 YceI family protein [Mucilaginibacter myungsuensis]MDN3599440.1 YceI family protein [Mucilaginibacter myungsuensis]
MLKKPLFFVTLALFTLSVRAQTYQLDVKKSKILWDTRKVVGQHQGDILFKSGVLNNVVGGRPDNGTFVIDMNTMRSTDRKKKSENNKVDREMRTPGFFDVKKHPTAAMTVKSVTYSAGTIYKVTGDLTIKGITHPIAFDADIQTNADQLTTKADIAFDREKWEIDFQQKKKDWNFFDAIKNQAVANMIAVKLDLVFNKQVAR